VDNNGVIDLINVGAVVTSDGEW